MQDEGVDGVREKVKTIALDLISNELGMDDLHNDLSNPAEDARFDKASLNICRGIILMTEAVIDALPAGEATPG